MKHATFRSPLLILVLLGSALLLPAAHAPSIRIVDGASVLAPAATSDDFSGSSLNTALWTVVDPVGDGTVALTGSQLTLSVPAGTSHDVWRQGNRALRVMQPTADTDFTLEVKFESDVTARYQLQGMLIEQSAGNFLRFDVHSDGSDRRLFAASFVSGTPTARHNQILTGAAPIWLRVQRVGNQWTLLHAADGQSWTAAVTFSHTMTVAASGVFAGNAGTNPSHTAVVDYFFDTQAPIDPEDGASNTDQTPPTISDVQVSPQSAQATIMFVTDEPATSHVAYGPTSSYGSLATETTSQTNHSLLLTGLTPATTYHYQITAEDAAGNLRTTADATFQTPENTSPTLTVWHSTEQKVGHLGTPQPDFNLMGNVSDPDGVEHLTYRLNNGPEQPLSIGNRSDGYGDGRRLAATGDFNADIPISTLEPGTNTIHLTATDFLGLASSQIVHVDRETGQSPLPYRIDWSQVNDPQDVGQYIDGEWGLENGGLRTLRTGYDRLFMIGDETWQDYEVTVPFVVHRVDPETGPYSGRNGLGIVLRFAGHQVGGFLDWPDAQPKWGYKPWGGLGWVRWSNGYDKSPTRFFLDGDYDVSRSFGTVGLTPGLTYWMKMRVETLPDTPSGEGVSTYRWKMWRDDQNEPADWDWSFTQTSEHALRRGGLLLVAHHVDATFGDVEVLPLDGPDDTSPPVVSNIQSTVDATSATLTWTTNEPANSRVDFGPTTAYEDGSVEDAALKTSHNITLTDLSASNTYHYRIVTTDGAGNTTTTPDSTFTTTASVALNELLSDEFDESTLDVTHWEIVDPLGDATVSMTGSQLSIAIPPGVTHDAWYPVSTAPRVLQTAPDADFEIEVKFDSPLDRFIQNYGILVEEAPDRFLRFDVYSTGSKLRTYTALITASSATRKGGRDIVADFPIWLRVQRTGNSWTYTYSTDGVSWAHVATFDQLLSVTKAGVFVGNAGDDEAPELIALIDYFRSSVASTESVATAAFEQELSEPDTRPYRFAPPAPNPVVHRAQFELTVAVSQQVTVDLFNLLGQRVRIVYSGVLAADTPLAGSLNADGLASGLYILRIQGESFVEHHKLIIVK